MRRVKNTQVLGERAFLDKLDPAFAARDLVDDSFVKTALREIGGASAFNLDAKLSRVRTNCNLSRNDAIETNFILRARKRWNATSGRVSGTGDSKNAPGGRVPPFN